MNGMRSRWPAFFYFVQLFVLFSTLSTVFFAREGGGNQNSVILSERTFWMFPIKKQEATIFGTQKDF